MEELRKGTEVQQNEGACPGSPDSQGWGQSHPVSWLQGSLDYADAICSDMEPAFYSLASVGILDDFLDWFFKCMEGWVVEGEGHGLEGCALRMLEVSRNLTEGALLQLLEVIALSWRRPIMWCNS